MTSMSKKWDSIYKKCKYWEINTQLILKILYLLI